VDAAAEQALKTSLQGFKYTATLGKATLCETVLSPQGTVTSTYLLQSNVAARFTASLIASSPGGSALRETLAANLTSGLGPLGCGAAVVVSASRLPGRTPDISLALGCQTLPDLKEYDPYGYSTSSLCCGAQGEPGIPKMPAFPLLVSLSGYQAGAANCTDLGLTIISTSQQRLVPGARPPTFYLCAENNTGPLLSLRGSAVQPTADALSTSLRTSAAARSTLASRLLLSLPLWDCNKEPVISIAFESIPEIMATLSPATVAALPPRITLRCRVPAGADASQVFSVPELCAVCSAAGRRRSAQEEHQQLAGQEVVAVHVDAASAAGHEQVVFSGAGDRAVNMLQVKGVFVTRKEADMASANSFASALMSVRKSVDASSWVGWHGEAKEDNDE